ncbi:MAG: putative type phosphodiesterase/nucleotide pyrophosphatase [Sporomusa sp.]|jgi:predicted AlkP superfamily phosphohydrolase/phosphomutase|nr:putative type phosphodiesterase/nucleotide pyrophosphatase [Sporomusa sp.]
MKKCIIFGVDGLMMPLLKKFAAEGILPNIDKMLKKGSATELLPFISAWGDVNWVSFLTGQCPGNTWIGQGREHVNQNMHNLLALMKDNGTRAALVNFIGSISTDAPHFQFVPYWGSVEPSPYELCPAMIHSTIDMEQVDKKKPKQQKLGWPPVAALAFHEKGDWRKIISEDGQYQLQLSDHSGESIILSICPEGSKLRIYAGQTAVDLIMGQWSQWLPIQINESKGKVRFFLGKFDSQDRHVEILQSQVMRLEGISNDAKLEKVLLEQFGPFISKWTSKVALNEQYRISALQEAEDQSLWLADSALYLTKKCGFSLWATVHRLIDESQHTCLGQYDPDSPFFKTETAEEYGNIIRECYKVLDRTMGRILEGMDKDTVLILASDHGGVPNSYMCDIYRYLERNDFVKLRSDGSVILEESKVFLKDERGGLEIYVNLQGREPQGMVSPEDFETVRESVLHLLGSWHVKENGQIRNAVSMALKKEDAMGIGYWGQYAGDIIFAYNTGFVWGVSLDGEDICPVALPGANHGPQKPTATTNMSSNYGAFLAYGDGIREGYYRERTTIGPRSMVDPAATIAEIFGIKQSSLDGSTMTDFLRK